MDGMLGWQERLRTPVEIRSDDRFLCSRDEFAAWAAGRQGLRMEFFYRLMRQRHGLLLDPAGGPEGASGTTMP
jgi:deoxyribodipyrimidine photolyase-related protein